MFVMQGFSFASEDLIEECTYIINHSTNLQNIEGAYYRRGEYYYENQIFDKAIHDFTESIKRSNKEPEKQAESYTYRAMAYFMTGNYNKAISDATIVINKGYADANLLSYFARGLSNGCIGNHKAAVNDLTNFIRIGKNKVDDSILMGQVGDALYYRAMSKIKVLDLNKESDVLNIINDLQDAIKYYTKSGTPAALQNKAKVSKILKDMGVK